MFDDAYLAQVDEYFLVSELLSFDLISLRDNWFRYSWVVRMIDSVRILICTHGGY